MTSKEIRKSFIKFFEKNNHKFVRSAPVVPMDDPSLLFTNAGMNQFKNIFIGVEKKDYLRATNTQKCIRVSGKHNDLEEVGRDTYHHTFFEMLGNWSFGDYYKKEAILWAWELLTDVWKLPKEKLWATVYKDDDEAEELWKTLTDINTNQILRFAEKDNFWEMGETGPCGPCSEIHIDLGEDACDKKDIVGHKCGVNNDCARYIELWNLVFIQYNRNKDGNLNELSAKHVDTGLGFERITAVLQGVRSNYETDIFTPILDKITQLTNKQYDIGEAGTCHRVIADHVRALTFAIADGAVPSNDGRGYVLRRILRRASRFARKLDIHEPMIYKLVSTLVDVMGEAFPEISEKHQYIAMVIKSEEESFNQTIDRGIELFEKLVADLSKKNISQIPGTEAFKLYDTYGFPLDLTELMADEKNFTVNIAGFEKEMESQRKRAREAGKWEYAIDIDYENWEKISTGSDSEFTGYDNLPSNSEIRRIKQDNDHIFLTLDKTPFYAESGGQVGDKGKIIGDNFELDVINTIKENDKIVHVTKGFLPEKNINSNVTAQINKNFRTSTARNHTASHLLQAALRNILGTHVHQSGSFVASDRLRFDLTHFEKISQDELMKIEYQVNQKILDNLTVIAIETTLDDAREQGATMLFGEKYSDIVRMIKIDDYSKELCGGTHVATTGQIGIFRIIAESSVAAGIRRIEAITGEEALLQINSERNIINSLKKQLGSKAEKLTERIEIVINDKKILEKELESIKQQSSNSEISELITKAKTIENFKFISTEIKVDSVDSLKQAGDILRDNLKSGVGVLGVKINNKINILCVVTDDLIKSRGLKAGDIVREIAVIVGGSGGGRPHLAMAGGKDLEKFDDALNKAEEIIKQKL